MVGVTKEPESESEAKEPSLLPAIRQFESVVAEEITRRWSLDQLDTNNPMVLAPLVDLRFKLIQSLPEHDKEVIKAKIIDQMNSFTAVTPSCHHDEVSI